MKRKRDTDEVMSLLSQYSAACKRIGVEVGDGILVGGPEVSHEKYAEFPGVIGLSSIDRSSKHRMMFLRAVVGACVLELWKDGIDVPNSLREMLVTLDKTRLRLCDAMGCESAEAAKGAQ